ncbi:MAG: M15 family metallopeptidase [Acidimicrobiales bacterium]
MSGSSRRGGDAGQALPVVTLVIVLTCLVALVLAELGGAAVARARARNAADAAALAGAAEGRAAAADVARANGGILREFQSAGNVVEVVVDVGDARERARAEATGPAVGPGSIPAGGGDRDGLAPAMVAALARADELLGRPLPVVSGFRSRAEQERLWANRRLNPYPVARPGTSDHERGVAVDVPRSFVPVLLTVASEAGLCQPLPTTDPVHFELCGS